MTDEIKQIMKSRLAQYFLWECINNTKIISTQKKIDKLNKKLKDQSNILSTQEVQKINDQIEKLQIKLCQLK